MNNLNQHQTYQAQHSHQTHDSQVQQYTFRDFLTPDPNSIIQVTGTKESLDALDHVLSNGACVNRVTEVDQGHEIYTPILIAINHAGKISCPQDYLPLTYGNLMHVESQPWFEILMKSFANQHGLDYAQLADKTVMTGDRIVVLLDALGVVDRIPKMQLGVIHVHPGRGIHACHYPSTAAPNDKVTAWIVVHSTPQDSQIYGIGSSAVIQQHHESTESEDERDDDNDAGQQPVETSGPSRKTAARVTAQQVPLPAGLTAANILQSHKNQLQYNNMLKVALVYSNQEISNECKAANILKQPSGVVKRLNTAINWIEQEFMIDTGAFRAAFDNERKSNGISIRSKDDLVDDTIVAANASKINAALTWVKTGGPRPTTT